MAIRAVLFDFGGVLTSSPFEAFAHYEHRNGLPEGFIRRVNATDPDQNAWARLERSQLDVDEFGAEFARESEALGHRVDGRDVLALLAGELRPAMVDAVRRCREHFATGLLTNNFAALMPDDHVAAFDHFDVVIESSKVGHRKPDPAFYELACAALEIEPTEAVFLDDLGVNLKPARNMGMVTIKVVDPATALAELAAVTGIPMPSP
jgi:putative hydrolase of the HAD superfamily